jgi:IS30 family transposase
MTEGVHAVERPEAARLEDRALHPLRAYIEDRLAMGWSPEQIAVRMEQEGSEHAISAEFIYRHVCSPGGRRTGLPRLLA